MTSERSWRPDSISGNPGVKLRIFFFYEDEGRKQPRPNIIVLFGYRVGQYQNTNTYIFIHIRYSFLVSYDPPYILNIRLCNGSKVLIFKSVDPHQKNRSWTSGHEFEYEFILLYVFLCQNSTLANVNVYFVLN